MTGVSVWGPITRMYGLDLVQYIFERHHAKILVLDQRDKSHAFL